METCVLPPLLENNTTEQGQTDHQPSAIPPTVVIDIQKTATLSDLIPAAAEALRTRHHLQQTTSDNSQATSFTESSLLCNQRPNATPFARALTKVKLQVQTKRLKERYLSHEWIRLALGLPVDISRINLHHYSREQLEADIEKKPSSGTDDLPPSPTSSLDTPPTSPCSRTAEIATWYEWKIDRSKFSVDQVQTKVDRLRDTKLRDKHTKLDIPFS